MCNVPLGRKKSRNGNTSVKIDGSSTLIINACETSRKSGAVTERLMSPIGRGMSEDTSPSPTTPPKLKKTPGTSTLEAAAATSKAKSIKNVAARITDYFSPSGELAAIDDNTHLTNGVAHNQHPEHEYRVYETGLGTTTFDSSVDKRRPNFLRENFLSSNSDIKPMILDPVLVSGGEDNIDQDDVGSEIIYATPEELEEDGCSSDGSNLGIITLILHAINLTSSIVIKLFK